MYGFFFNYRFFSTITPEILRILYYSSGGGRATWPGESKSRILLCIWIYMIYLYCKKKRKNCLYVYICVGCIKKMRRFPWIFRLSAVSIRDANIGPNIVFAVPVNKRNEDRIIIFKLVTNNPWLIRAIFIEYTTVFWHTL